MLRRHAVAATAVAIAGQESVTAHSAAVFGSRPPRLKAHVTGFNVAALWNSGVRDWVSHVNPPGLVIHDPLADWAEFDVHGHLHLHLNRDAINQPTTDTTVSSHPGRAASGEYAACPRHQRRTRGSPIARDRTHFSCSAVCPLRRRSTVGADCGGRQSCRTPPAHMAGSPRPMVDGNHQHSRTDPALVRRRRPQHEPRRADRDTRPSVAVRAGSSLPGQAWRLRSAGYHWHQQLTRRR